MEISQLARTITTFGQLKKQWKPRSIKDEMRENLIAKIRNDETLFPDVLGYEKTVIPQVKHAILARHDILLLGLRGQAKTRILRSMTDLLDDFLPVVAGSPINDDPFQPLSLFAKKLLAEKGDDTPIVWLSRQQRYAEKLATPDTTVADLIGDVDPIKAAVEKRTLADEEVINFGLIPRANRGIFVINELPDLQPRIQVALLNIMQERDVQIRGFNLRIPVDVAIFFSANPEDYTNRGNIITPLKDRIDAQIITHYPRSREIGIEITRQEAWQERSEQARIVIPHFVREIVEQTAMEARQSEYVDQKSGVSARLTITMMEQIISAAERRTIITGSQESMLRISDIYHATPALTGKIELVYEGEQEGAATVAQHLIGKAINAVFLQYFPNPISKKPRRSTRESAAEKTKKTPYDGIQTWFNRGNVLDLPDVIDEQEYRHRLNKAEGLAELVIKHTKVTDPAEMAPLMDLVIEGLHQNSLLSKDDHDEHRRFTDMAGSLLGNLNFGEDDDFDEEDFLDRN